jgi:LPXTG-site transpeptidase (sortase) family protein
VTRLTIPSIGVDSEVVEVGWHVETLNGQPVTIWDVAKYAVGHHHASGNPGEENNIVLAGHSGGFGAIFRDLIQLQPGDEVVLYGDNQQYLYVVEEILLLQEINVPMEERLRNAQYMAHAEEERVTLITCWPVPIYDKRIIVLARPYQAEPFSRPDLIAD